jgi:hypothetical protein
VKQCDHFQIKAACLQIHANFHGNCEKVFRTNITIGTYSSSKLPERSNYAKIALTALNAEEI